MEEKRCLFCFLSSHYQKKIMKLSQLQEEKFEDILKRYSNKFISDFFIILKNPLCKKHENILYRQEIILNLKKKKNLRSSLKTFFKDLIDIYVLWISGEAYHAIENLNNIFNNSLSNEDIKFEIGKKLFFRGRKNINNILNKYDMFHIPYDKRYLVRNQRFSLSGFPLLYLSSSLFGVYLELDIENEYPREEYSFSSFYFNNDAKIYSLDNPFRIHYDNTKTFIKESSILENNLEKKLLKLILSSVCLFEKRFPHKLMEKKGINIFYEEYVLPQALTQVLKLNKYHGVFYPSTRIKNTLKDDLFDINNFNLAYFPEYKKKRHYDIDLFNNLNISVPINFSKEILTNIFDVPDIYSLGELFKRAIANAKNSDNTLIIKLSNLLSIYENLFDKYYLFLSEIDDVKYSENDKVKYKENLIFEILIIYNFLEKSLLDLLNKKGGKK